MSSINESTSLPLKIVIPLSVFLVGIAGTGAVQIQKLSIMTEFMEENREAIQKNREEVTQRLDRIANAVERIDVNSVSQQQLHGLRSDMRGWVEVLRVLFPDKDIPRFPPD